MFCSTTKCRAKTSQSESALKQFRPENFRLHPHGMEWCFKDLHSISQRVWSRKSSKCPQPPLWEVAIVGRIPHSTQWVIRDSAITTRGTLTNICFLWEFCFCLTRILGRGAPVPPSITKILRHYFLMPHISALINSFQSYLDSNSPKFHPPQSLQKASKQNLTSARHMKALFYRL